MSRPHIETFLIDEKNEEKFAMHGISVRQVLEVLENVHTVLRNRKQRRGLYLVVGRDNGGICISIPVQRTHQAALWRPITAWRCKSHEVTMLEKKGRQHE